MSIPLFKGGLFAFQLELGFFSSSGIFRELRFDERTGNLPKVNERQLSSSVSSNESFNKITGSILIKISTVCISRYFHSMSSTEQKQYYEIII